MRPLSENEIQSCNSAANASALIQMRLWPTLRFLLFANGQTHSTNEHPGVRARDPQLVHLFVRPTLSPAHAFRISVIGDHIRVFREFFMANWTDAVLFANFPVH